MSESKVKLDKKKAEFEKDPNSFVHVNDIVIGIVLRPDKADLKMRIDNVDDFERAYAIICGEYPFARMQAIRMKVQKEKGNIITPDGKS